MQIKYWAWYVKFILLVVHLESNFPQNILPSERINEYSDYSKKSCWTGNDTTTQLNGNPIFLLCLSYCACSIILPVRCGCRPEFGEHCSDAGLSRTGKVCTLMPENTVQWMLWSSPSQYMIQHAGDKKAGRTECKKSSHVLIAVKILGILDIYLKKNPNEKSLYRISML